MNLSRKTIIISLLATMLFFSFNSIMVNGAQAGAQEPSESIVDNLKENIEAELNQQAAQAASPASGAPVVIDGVELFSIKIRVTSFYPEDRANLIQERVIAIAKNRAIEIEDIQLKTSTDDNLIEIVANNNSISTVTEDDAAAEELSLLQVAEERRDKIREAVQNYREMREAKILVLQFTKAFLLTALLIVLFIFTRRINKHFKSPATERALLTKYLLKIPGGHLVPTDILHKVVGYFVLIFIALLRLFVLYFYLSLVLGLFPWTAVYSKQLLSYVYAVFYTCGNVLVNYMPNITIIVIILFISSKLRKLIFFFFRQLKSENIKISGFYPEWADTTYKISIFFLVALTAIIMYPYVPGTKSLAFQSVTVFFGLLLSLGSSSVVANIVAGVALTYTRSFRIGDRVKIGDNMGDIIEKSMLSIRMRTVKNEDITIPNSAIVNNPVVNYSSSSLDSALVLHITVTMSYDVPWTLANKLLIEAALMTNDVLQEPRPFVLQKKLNDFSVSHEINAFTLRPGKMSAIYSEMHKNILDKLFEAGIDPNTPQRFIIQQAESPSDDTEKD